MLTVNEDILLLAFRYALGRRSYSVSDVVEELIKQEPNLTWWNKDQIREEIDIAYKKNALGDDCDRKLWLYVRNLFDRDRRFMVEANLYETKDWVKAEAVLGDDGKYYSLDNPNKWYHTTRREIQKVF